MITAQDIREKSFEKSKIGGYDMAEVDEFLEQIADDLTNAQKETAVLKSKMKVLVDKIEEYRGNENALNQTLLSAQKLASQIESEAKERAAKMIADAEAEVKEKTGDIDARIKTEEKKLADAKAASSKFFDGIRAMCNAQLKNIDALDMVKEVKKSVEEKIPEINEAPAAVEKKVEEVKPAVEKAAQNFEAKFAKEAADIEEAVRSIEASVARKQPQPAANFDFSADMDAPFSSAKEDKDSTQPFTF